VFCPPLVSTIHIHAVNEQDPRPRACDDSQQHYVLLCIRSCTESRSEGRRADGSRSPSIVRPGAVPTSQYRSDRKCRRQKPRRQPVVGRECGKVANALETIGLSRPRRTKLLDRVCGGVFCNDELACGSNEAGWHTRPSELRRAGSWAWATGLQTTRLMGAIKIVAVDRCRWASMEEGLPRLRGGCGWRRQEVRRGCWHLGVVSSRSAKRSPVGSWLAPAEQ
jgi:hypothetical protein